LNTDILIDKYYEFIANKHDDEIKELKKSPEGESYV